ncbi:MAG: hypothetical protein LQ338_008123 [Usnochroma carphineum]|nr:MAG: hypothetical protein LQ338_008123 [Usnochroma carphineum]
MADSTPKSYHTDPTLYLYTSLTAGSSQIVTATARLETILKANRIAFKALDVATDEKARMLWGRRAGKRKLPGLVRMGMLVGDLEEIEEWNEYGELKEKVGVSAQSSTPSAANTPTKAPQHTSQSTSTPSKLSTTESSSAQPSSAESSWQTKPSSQTESPMAAAMRQAGMEAAQKAGDVKAKVLAKAGIPSKSPSEAQSKLVSPESAGAPSSSGTKDFASAQNPGSQESTPAPKADTDPDTERTSNVPRDDVYEGRGIKDPDKEAVVPDSKDTLNMGDHTKSSARNVKSGDADAGAVVPGSRDRIETEDSEKANTKEAQAKDPDAEVIVPGSKDKFDTEEKSLTNRGIASKKSDDDEHGDGGKARGRNNVENTTNATAASDQAQDLPGKRTHDQAPAQADEAGTSVAD